MSKRCNTCGATNFESATICINCGSLFKDGAYSPNVSKTRRFKMPAKEAIRIEKTSKAIVGVIACIVAVIAVITVVCIFAFRSDKVTDTIDKGEVAAAVQQETNSDDKKSTIGSYAANSMNSNDDSGSSGEYIDRITAAEKNIELNVGEVTTLSVSLYPENPSSRLVNWYSDNEDVVCLVEYTQALDCEIEAVGEGTATITIEGMGEGLEVVSETITITVVDSEPVVTPEETTDNSLW